MNLQKSISILLFSFVFASCGSPEEKQSNATSVDVTEVQLSLSDKIMKDAITAHGGELYNSAHYSFEFRGNTYKFKNEDGNYEYNKVSQQGDSIIKDVLINGVFTRAINGSEVELTEKEINSGTGAINSVIYFATLPYKLGDAAVNTHFIGDASIKGETYDVIEVTFDQEGGGEDHDDEYYYWLNKETKKMDYFAYNYSVNNGGVRFRSANNSRIVDGITFQDYVNYKAEVGTPLLDLPRLFEAGELIKLSEVNTENVINLK